MSITFNVIGIVDMTMNIIVLLFLLLLFLINFFFIYNLFATKFNCRQCLTLHQMIIINKR